ncbi:MAG TPA: hypothetical protein VFK61_03190, partial [Candidatus Limnocylindria bacterium]|nr:hypothetical protein [Candidatus Limnocylindria bacterium]
MTLLDRIMARGAPMPSDPILAARIERHLRRIQPDPLFRRRLRSMVVNRYVAAREGMVPVASERRASRQMGRLGRSVLYASVLTALGVSAVGAAAQDSLPGDGLYGVKLQLESIRTQIAPPGLHDDLAAMALDLRLGEVERLAAAGRWDQLDAAAARALAAEERLAALRPGMANPVAGTFLEAAMGRHARRLAELMTTAPAAALEGLQRALVASQGLNGPPTGNGNGGTNNGGTNNGGTNNGGTNNGG